MGWARCSDLMRSVPKGRRVQMGYGAMARRSGLIFEAKTEEQADAQLSIDTVR